MKNKYIIYLLLTFVFLSCEKQNKKSQVSQKRTKIIAHRGFSSVAPENTLAAFQKAVDIEADYFELDVHKTKDNKLVVIHDNSVDRTSSNGRKGNVYTLTYKELNKIKVGYPKKFGDEYIEEKIPLLREALQLAKGKIKVCIEIKTHNIEKEVLEIIDNLRMNREVMILSFHFDILSKLRKLDKQIPILYLSDYANKQTIEYAVLINAKAIGVGYKTNPTKEFIEYAHKKGVEVWKWTVNTEKDMINLIDLGIDGIITNFPDKALAIRGEKKTEITKSKKSLIEEKVDSLISKMTLTDKVGEMTQLSVDMLLKGEPYKVKEPLEFDMGKLQKVLLDLKVGSILNNGGHARSLSEWHQILSKIQSYAINKKSTGIPVLYGIDAIHGANYTSNATLYPQQLNLAATWNRELVEELASISAYETRASAIPWTFAPVLDVGRDPRWSRFWETFGEDTYLVKEMGKATIKGMQGERFNSPYKVASCMKHFLGYSAPKSGKDRTPSYIPERQLRELFLPPFKAAIDAGAKTVMINSGELNGIPVHANPKILIDLLRHELGFKGIAVTDWEDIKYLYERHHIAKDYKDAIRISINAGIDMSMVAVDLEFPKLLKELVEEGAVAMSRIDESVRRILTLKYELGLFDKAFYPVEDYPEFASEKYKQKAFQGALESIVLLKNKNQILPISKNKKILVTGPTANSLAAINGAWTGTWQGKDKKYNTPNKKTILESLIDEYGANINFVKGSTVNEPINIDKAVQVAKKSDVAVICIGEMPYVEIPGNINDLTLSKAQIDLVTAISNTGIPIVLVLVEGRPRVVNTIEPLAKGIVFAGLPGNEGGRAIAQILIGNYNPNGRLPFTYPRFVNDLIHYDHKYTENKDIDFSDNGFNPQWEFAHGLSYTSFSYDNLEIKNIDKDNFSISIQVKNTGNKTGSLIIPLFISDKVASITPSVKRLKGFKKIKLENRETQKINFNISKEDLKFVGINNKWIFEPGKFEVEIGNLTKMFTVDN